MRVAVRCRRLSSIKEQPSPFTGAPLWPLNNPTPPISLIILFLPQYETALNGENSSGLQQLAYHTVNRRYREFLNLQTRLEEKPDLRKFIKSQKFPKPQMPACISHLATLICMLGGLWVYGEEKSALRVSCPEFAWEAVGFRAGQLWWHPYWGCPWLHALF